MTRADLSPLVDPVALARVREPLARAWTLPPAGYTDPRIFALERERIFARDWICVARADQLSEPGDFLCADLPDQPLVLVRGYDGALRALSRICQHRAMPVVTGAGRTRRFVCPYHNWTYELSGELRSAPMMEGAEEFDPARCRLPEVGLEVWNGFVFVNLDASAPALGPQLEGLAALVEHYDFGDLVVAASTEYDSPWNWKILVENFMEAYHHIGTHRDSFEPTFPARESRVEDNGGGPWAFLRMPGKPQGGDAPGLFPRLSATERQQLFAAAVYPTLLFAGSAAGAFWYELQPRAHDAMALRIHVLLPRAVASGLDDAARAEAVATVRAIHDEDVAANLGPWRGLHGTLTGQGRLSPFEKAIWQLNQLWLARMEAALREPA